MISATVIDLFQHCLRASVHATVLAAVVLLFQFVFRRRLSANWRFALWIPVLIRLLLPVAPESRLSMLNISQLIHSSPEQPKVKAPENRSPSVLPLAIEPLSSDLADPQIKTQTLPIPSWDWKLFAAATWLSGAMITAGFYLAGFRKIRCLLGRGKKLEHSELWQECRQRLGIMREVQLIESHEVDSPGLVGAFQPKLLLPPDLESQLSRSELRHIFLHECAHLKRRDLWTNLFLLLIQAAHWFNPFVWLVTSRIRADREIACDAIALEQSSADERQAYGETILKLIMGIDQAQSVHGLVGIIENKRQITRRVKMLVKLKTEKRSTLLATMLLGLLLVTGVSEAQTDRKAVVPEAETPISQRQLQQQESNSKALIKRMDARKLHSDATPRANGQIAPDAFPEAASTRSARQALWEKLHKITLEELAIPASIPLLEVVKELEQECRRRDPDHRGINFVISSTAYPNYNDVEKFEIKINPPLRNIRIIDAMDAIVRVAVPSKSASNQRLRYSIEDYAVIFRASENEAPALYTRSYRLDPNTIIEGLNSRTFPSLAGTGLEAEPESILVRLRRYLDLAGAEFPTNSAIGSSSAPQKAIFYKEQTGTLLVRGTLKDLDIVEAALQAINVPPSIVSPPLISFVLDVADGPHTMGQDLQKIGRWEILGQGRARLALV